MLGEGMTIYPSRASGGGSLSARGGPKRGRGGGDRPCRSIRSASWSTSPYRAYPRCSTMMASSAIRSSPGSGRGTLAALHADRPARPSAGRGARPRARLPSRRAPQPGAVELSSDELTAGDLGLALWAESRADGDAVPELVRVLGGRLREERPGDRGMSMEVAWMVIGLTEAGARGDLGAGERISPRRGPSWSRAAVRTAALSPTGARPPQAPAAFRRPDLFGPRTEPAGPDSRRR